MERNMLDDFQWEFGIIGISRFGSWQMKCGGRFCNSFHVQISDGIITSVTSRVVPPVLLVTTLLKASTVSRRVSSPTS